MTIPSSHMKRISLTPTTVVCTILGVAVLGLVCYNLRDMVMGTPITISAATDGATLSSPFLPISGTARHARSLEINGRPVPVDRKGTFTDEVLLSPGYNIVEVASVDQFGKTKVKTYQVVVNTPEAVATTIGTPYQ